MMGQISPTQEPTGSGLKKTATLPNATQIAKNPAEHTICALNTHPTVVPEKTDRTTIASRRGQSGT